MTKSLICKNTKPAMVKEEIKQILKDLGDNENNNHEAISKYIEN